jgi:hypothetical protein
MKLISSGKCEHKLAYVIGAILVKLTASTPLF